MRIWVDADACPVKDEIEKIAFRRGVKVVHVCGLSEMRREAPGVEVVFVPEGPDAADEYIVEHCEEGDLIVTYDVPLAVEAIRQGAAVLEFRGRELTKNNIPMRSGMRDLLKSMRDQGAQTRGPQPFAKKDRTSFCGALARMLDRLLAAEPE